MVEIENYRQQPIGGTVQAIFDIWLPNIKLRFRNWKLIQTKKGHKFVAAPAFAVDGIEGKKDFIPYVEFEKERAADFNKTVLEKLKEFER